MAELLLSQTSWNCSFTLLVILVLVNPILCHFKHCNSVRLLTKRNDCTLSERAASLGGVRPSRAACGACRQSGRAGSLRSCSFYRDKKRGTNTLSAAPAVKMCHCVSVFFFFLTDSSDTGLKRPDRSTALKHHQFVWTSEVLFKVIRKRTTPLPYETWEPFALEWGSYLTPQWGTTVPLHANSSVHLLL